MLGLNPQAKRPWWFIPLFVLLGAMLCARIFIEVVDGMAIRDMGNAIATIIVSVIIVAGFLFFRKYFREFDFQHFEEPPLGWSPTLTEENARNYRGFQMQLNEHGQLVPIKLSGADSNGDAPKPTWHNVGIVSPQDPSADFLTPPARAGARGPRNNEKSSSKTAAIGHVSASAKVAPTSNKRKVRIAPTVGKRVDAEVEVGPALGADGSLPTPLQIYNALGEYVIGQEEARKTLSVAVYNHYKRTIPAGDRRERARDVEIAKSNIMLLGPTGSGKTLMVQTLARILDVPLAIADATTLTDAGYVGDDVESMLGRLIAAAGSPEAASLGIVYVDEIDKIARGGGQQGSFSLNGDPSGEGVQQAMLKLLEGTQAKVPPLGGRTNLFQRDTQIDTTNVLFICGGAFVGLTDIVRRRTTDRGIGFAANASTLQDLTDDELLAMVEPEDLHRFGLIPEFVGRIPIITYTKELDAEAMVRILTEPRNALVRQYQELFAYDGVELEFDDDALEAIGKQALERGTGARGLRSICERVLRDAMFEIPGSNIARVIVHAPCVTDNEPLEYVRL